MKPTIKRLARRVVPDRVMARYRLEQHSRFSRVNVDVFVEGRREARRWLSVTPDTYRIRLSLPDGTPPGDVVIVEDASIAVRQPLKERATRIMADQSIAAAIVAETGKPRLVDRRRSEPVLAPRLILVRRGVLEEVGGPPRGPHPLPGLLARLRDAGHLLGLVPIASGVAGSARTDPIEQSAVVILAAVPMHDIGGGSRSTQLALEFVRQGYHVTLISLYEAQETVDLGLRYIHPGLEQYQAVRFDPTLHDARVGSSGVVLVEAPAAPLVSKALALRDMGWKLVYDLIDDWSDRALGGEWYREDLEKHLVEKAHRVIASAPDLVSRIERMGREATLVPNAVNAEIFAVDTTPEPVDLPKGKQIIGYHGSLYGDWFDWDALRQVALANPAAAVVVIGDDKAPRPVMPDNVHFLGLKPQTDLPAYLQRFDIGIIPFELSETTHAVSPLKAYEYLASGVPVAAPPLRTLTDLDGVTTSTDLVEATRAALRRPKPDRAGALREHSWASRVAIVLGTELLGRGGPSVRSVLRRAKHHAAARRLIP